MVLAVSLMFLFNMTISLVIDATRHVGSGTIGTVLFSC